jgi:hypothetical protein
LKNRKYEKMLFLNDGIHISIKGRGV